MKIIMLITLSLTLTMVSCSKKKGADAPTSSSGGGGSSTSITYYSSDTSRVATTALNTGKTVSSCSCSSTDSNITVSCSVVLGKCYLSSSVSNGDTSSKTVSVTANYSPSGSATTDYTLTHSPVTPPAPTLSAPTATGLDTSGATPTLTSTISNPISDITFPSDHSVSSCTYTGTLPAGLTFDSTDCSIQGTPSAGTTSSGQTITVSPTGAGGAGTTQTVKIIIPVPPVVSLNTSSSPDVVATDSTHLVLTAHSGDSTGLQLSVSDFPITGCTINPSLPAGMTLDSTNCSISGNSLTQTPSTGNTYTITPTGAGGAASSIELKIKTYTKWCDGHTDTGSSSNGKKTGDGLSGNPFILCGKDGIKFLKNTTSNDYPTVYYYKLQSDVDLSSTSGYTSPYLTYLPIGNSNEKFNGVFDGAGYKISNQLVSETTATAYGLFTYTSGSAEIKNFILDNSSISVPGLVGGIIGNATSGTTKISNIIVVNSKVASSATTDAGNLVGLVSSGANLDISNVLIHSAQASSGSKTSVFVGSSPGGTISFTDAIYDAAMTSYLAQSGSPSGITSFALSTLKSDSSATTYGGIASSSAWDLSPVKASGGSTPLLIKRAEQRYTDTVVKP